MGPASGSRAGWAGKILSLPLVPILILFFVLVLPAGIPGLVALHDPVEVNVAARLSPPVFFGGTWKFPLGTDRLGRCIFSRLVYGARVSLSVALTAIFFSGLIGAGLGFVAGYFGGWLDALLMRMVDVSLSIPLILLALTFAVAFGPSFGTIIIVIVFTLWAYYTRQVRGEVLSLRERDFIARAKVAGASDLRIIVRHLFPNVTNTITVLATLQVGQVIMMEAALSFLGMGIPRPQPAWGLMVADGRQLIASAWWMSFFPGMAILLIVLSLNLLGDWLRDRLDPKLRQI
jgi:peptide/nickel transport system permease protein